MLTVKVEQMVISLFDSFQIMNSFMNEAIYKLNQDDSAIELLLRHSLLYRGGLFRL
jgi:hypothetical protein